MITQDNFKNLLHSLKFKDYENYFIKHFDLHNCDLKVDFENKLLIYPEDKGLIVNEKQTCNFNANENFVVFECVNRLLTKGYKPEHIELEPKWKLGHGSSGGRADILIKDNTGSALLIIECKTWGSEFEAEWKNMIYNGGQLFSYAQQIKSTKYLCLYTSDFEEDTSKYGNHIITLNDNKEYLKTLKEPITFEDAKDVITLYKAWYVTYNHEYETKGIFEDAHAAYEIGKAKHTAADLAEINHDDIQKKYHDFATILRQHNVSGRENAFDKLVNLFLAKIVDEMQDADELKFYWRGVAFDNYYDLQDRIQRLYRDGMQKFLNEEVTYIDNDDIKKAFRLFKNDPDATRNQIEEYFRKLKFYTNNDFAFLDVHNQHLFYQNSAILLKIVRMLQDIKLKTEEQNQFLGDLFEGFLDQGIKQSEGQFFTPTPIVKFLVSSLPLKMLVEDSAEPLKVIDYACGAGHFLNEYATQIRAFLPKERLSEFYGNIVGIEKECRLSKVAKVSAFMYGQEEIQIIYADALAENQNIQNGTYNVLISNPPYSVKGFLETLTEEERAAFEITNVIDTKSIITNNSIEVFFVERAKQLLAPGGVAAIILPSSLISNSGAVYTKGREIILKYFDVIAIAEFGSGTFGKTGTNTVTMFLRRKEENPALAEHYRNRINAWFNYEFGKDEVFNDTDLIMSYCQHVGFEINDYKTLLNSLPNEELLDSDAFKAYRNSFYNLSVTKNRIKQKSFQALSEEAQREELQNRFKAYAREIEKEKLYYFMLAYTNPQNVIVVKSPSDTKEIKRFLGYEWSNRKGSEGIKYIDVTTSEDDDDDTLSRLKGIKSIQTPLFNPADLLDAEKINSIIRTNFNSGYVNEREDVKQYRLVDMIDFNGIKFDKTISLVANMRKEIISKYPLVPLNTQYARVNKGTSITQANSVKGKYKVVAGGIDYAYKHNTYNREANVITVSASGANAGYVNFWKEPIFASDCTTVYGVEGSTETKYLYYILKMLQNQLRRKANAAQPHVYPEDITTLKIPLPPIDVQIELVKACEDVDMEYERTRMSIKEYRNKIEQLFNDMEIISGEGTV